jgi:hypothetical protein
MQSLGLGAHAPTIRYSLIPVRPYSTRTHPGPISRSCGLNLAL